MRAVRQLRAFTATVARTSRRGKMRAELAAVVTGRGREAAEGLLALLRRPYPAGLMPGGGAR